MTYVEQSDLAKEPNFLLRIRQATISAAVAVQAELDTTPNHAERTRFARLVLRGTAGVIERVAMAVTTNVAVTPQSVDNDLLFTVNSLWNTFALGVFE